ncbi:MAG: sn-glycerol-1-phosphate dehydrogenase [Ruminococcaceae bacterium]|nr:sn-glycerol-1-phosphate dehydrogenase [Oscillospiraceae bacterium]
MDLKKILHSLENCPCGRKHTFVTEIVEIESGLTARMGKILADANFPKKVLLVSDENAMKAAKGTVEAIEAAGFEIKKLIYQNMMYAKIEQVREVEALCADVDGVIALGTGSINDICRVASFRQKKEFSIVATAPSMDGFASDTAPIIENNFKNSFFVEQPRIILADTKVLAKAPLELKAAGFGDMVAKYIGIADWQIANLLIDEYYCPAVADITMQGVKKVVDLAEQVNGEDEVAAGNIMEGLILSGLGMKLAKSSRPASGAEHVVSHYLECYKLARGIWPEFHGKKVGVASVLINRIYHNIADRVEEVNPTADNPDWDLIRAQFDTTQHAELMKVNEPSIMDKVDPARLKAIWPDIRRIIKTVLPTDEEMMKMMRAAGAATEPADVHVDDELLEKGLRYHAYMRYRILLTRLMPMLGLDIMDFVK